MTTSDIQDIPLLNPGKTSVLSIGVGSVIINNDQVLMVRSTDETSKWKFPGGHLQIDENLNQAVLRETLEETGCVISTIGQPVVYEYDLNENRRLFLLFFKAKLIDTIAPSQEGEIIEIKWFDLNQLPDNCYENVIPVLNYFKSNL